jgi:hypothetical protein
MRLRKAQQNILLTWIAEGLDTSEINQRAAKFRPRFKVSKQQVDFYRKSRGLQLEEIKESGEADALTIGLALKEERVKALKQLADKMFDELLQDPKKWWLPQVKGIGQGDNFERVDYFEFNKGELESFRGVLDDIAAEVGDRIKRVDATSGGNPLQTASPEQIAQRVASLMELAKKRKETNGS